MTEPLNVFANEPPAISSDPRCPTCGTWRSTRYSFSQAAAAAEPIILAGNMAQMASEADRQMWAGQFPERRSGQERRRKPDPYPFDWPPHGRGGLYRGAGLPAHHGLPALPAGSILEGSSLSGRLVPATLPAATVAAWRAGFFYGCLSGGFACLLAAFLLA